MRKFRVFTFSLLLIATLFSLNAFAQDWGRQNLPEGATLRIGKGTVHDIAYSPDGTRLAVASAIGIWLYDAATYREIALIAGHTGGIDGIAFSPDGSTLASVGGWWNNTIRVRNLTTGVLVRTLEGPESYESSVVFSPDGRMLASGNTSNTVPVWDVSTGEMVASLETESGRASSIAFGPDGETLASANEDRTIRIWNVLTGALVKEFHGHTDLVSSIAFSPDGSTLASGGRGSDSTIRIWDVFSGQQVRTLAGHNSSVTSISFSPDGQTLASGSRNDSVRLWNALTGDVVHTLGGNIRAGRGRNYVVAFSPDGRTLVSGSNHGAVHLWDSTSGDLMRTLEGYTGGVTSIALSKNDDAIASATQYGTIRHWNALTGNQKLALQVSDWAVDNVALSPDGLITASQLGDQIRLWHTTTGAEVQTLRADGGDGVIGIAFSPDGRMLVTGHWDQTVRLWDMATGALVKTLEGHTEAVNFVAFSPDGSMIASGSYDDTARLWNVATGALVRTVEGHRNSVSIVAFSPDGQTLAIGSDDNFVRLWDVTTGALLGTLTSWGWVKGLAFSPDGLTLAIGGGHDSTIGIWDVSTGTVVRTLPGHSDWVSSIAFSGDGMTLVSGSNDGTILLWDVASLQTPDTPQTPDDVPTDDVTEPPPSGTVVSISPATIQSPAVGKQFTVNIDITGGANVTGYQVALTYDASILSLVSLENADYLQQAFVLAPEPAVKEAQGEVKLSATSVDLTSDGDGTLATATFEVVEVKDSSIGLTSFLADAAPAEIAHVTEGSTVSGATAPDDGPTDDGPTDDATTDDDGTTDGVITEPPPTGTFVSISPAAIQSPQIGGQFDINIDIGRGSDVVSYAIELAYDASALSLVALANADYLPSAYVLGPTPAVAEAQGHVILSVASFDGPSDGDGTLVTATFEVVNAADSSIRLEKAWVFDVSGAASRVPVLGSNVYGGAAPNPSDVNGDGVVDIADLVLIAQNYGQTGENTADVNGDGVVDAQDFVLAAGAIDSAAAPSARHQAPVMLSANDVRRALAEARTLNLADPVAQRGILYLKRLLAALIPKETVLLANYPNPFNPETWIPYRLATDAPVRLCIYDRSGCAVRTINLGHRRAAAYESRTEAIYWDGRNDLGEQVASGLYFYTLSAGDYKGTRKMLVGK